MEKSSIKASAILVAGGVGSRMKAEIPKQYLPLKNKAIALYSFELFCSMSEISEIIVVCDTSFRSLFQHSFEKRNEHQRLAFAEPGQRRQDSVYHGLQAISPSSSLVCIHDSARPLINRKIVLNALEAADLHGAAAVGMPIKFTIKECSQNQMVLRTPDRSSFWEIQTPQVIRLPLLKEGFVNALRHNLTVTDDAALVELIHHPVKMVEGSYANLKITTPEDLIIAEQLLSFSEG